MTPSNQTPHFDQRAVPVSSFTTKFDKDPKRQSLSLAALCQWRPAVVAPSSWNEKLAKWEKPDGIELWSPATYAPGAERRKENVEAAYLLALDLDSGPKNGVNLGAATAKLLASLAVGPRVCFQTTYNHTPALPRYRITWLLSRPVDRYEYEKLWFRAKDWIVDILGQAYEKALDPQTKDASRMYYVPTVPDDSALTCYRSELLGVEGISLDVDAWLAAGTRPAPQALAPMLSASEVEALRAAKMATPSKGLRMPQGGDPAEWFARLCQTHPPAVHGDSGHSTLLGLANYGVVGLALDPAEAAEIAWLHYNDRCDPPWGDHERRDFDRKFAEARPQGDAQSGYLLPAVTPLSLPVAPVAPQVAAVAADDDDALWAACVADRKAKVLPVPLVEGVDLYDGAITSIAGWPHTGKTPTAMLLAYCLANGQPFLGRATRKRPVLYVNFEKGPSALATSERLAQGLGVDPLSVHLVNASDLGMLLTTAGVVDKLARLVKRLHRTTGETPMIVIDTLASSVIGLSHNDNEYLDPFRALVGSVRQIAPCSVAMLVHCKKALAENEPPKLGDIGGSLQIVANCDAVIGLYKPYADRPSVIRMIPIRTNREDAESITYEWSGRRDEPLTCRPIEQDPALAALPKPAGSGAKVSRKDALVDSAYALLAAHVEVSPIEAAWTFDDFRKVARCSSNDSPKREACRKAIKQLEEDNIIVKTRTKKQTWRKLTPSEIARIAVDARRSAELDRQNSEKETEVVLADDARRWGVALVVPESGPGHPPTPAFGGFGPTPDAYAPKLPPSIN